MNLYGRLTEARRRIRGAWAVLTGRAEPWQVHGFRVGDGSTQTGSDFAWRWEPML